VSQELETAQHVDGVLSEVERNQGIPKFDNLRENCKSFSVPRHGRQAVRGDDEQFVEKRSGGAVCRVALGAAPELFYPAKSRGSVAPSKTSEEPG
jgi:hypothetical protein